MNSALAHPRLERKFIAVQHNLHDVLALVRQHPSAFREAFPPRLIHNVYLDTPSLTDYHEHVNGSANRKKTRVRWYGVLKGDPIKPVLERKLKRGLVSGKMSEPLRPATVEQALSRAGLEALLSESRLSEPVAASARFLEPSLYNCYHRRYFVSLSGHVRLTIDWALNFARPGKINRGGLEARRWWSFSPIIELKFEPQHAEEAALVANHFPFRLVRCSKYVLGVEALAGL